MVSGISIFEMDIFQTYQMLGIYFTSLFWHHFFFKSASYPHLRQPSGGLAVDVPARSFHLQPARPAT
ncbi:hypothetical protein, partial [Novosphingobium olei]|uniref:hypothetical protein n=1 Tax=Novosphingobium olei TaxID=2728851 RepID=UPI00197F4198